MDMTNVELRAARKRLGLTQPALSRKLGVGKRTYQEWERGDREIKTLVELAIKQLGHAETIDTAVAKERAACAAVIRGAFYWREPLGVKHSDIVERLAQAIEARDHLHSGQASVEGAGDADDVRNTTAESEET